jgi:predicted MPP superfamily phosphohydrolase
MGNNNIRGGFLRNSHPIVYEILFAACVAIANLIVLFIIYDGRHNLELPRSPIQTLSIVIIAMMVFVSIWRNYIYNRMHHHEYEDRHEGKEHGRDTFMQQLFPYWYRISCGLMFLGNCMLPMQILFSSNLLDLKTGDPYQFNIVCALCFGFVFTMIGLNILSDTSIFIAQKVFGWTTLYQQLHVLLSSRRWCHFRAPLVFLLSAKIVLGGALIAKEDPIVVQVTVPISHLPDSLENFRIIQLSDVHIGVTIGRTRVKKVVDIVNDLCSGSDDNCNLIALTGDIVDGEPHGLMKAIEPLGNLCPGRDVPKLFVPGNHEHIHFIADQVVTVLSEIGIDSLVNDNIRLHRDETRENQLVVVGFDDLSSRRYRGKEQQAFDGIDAEKDTTILLAHQPNHLKVAERYGVDLMLSGHTHAGQFYPGNILAWLFNSRFSGYYPSRGKTAVYVSAGTLFWGPPVRFSTRHHEITDIRLVRSQ